MHVHSNTYGILYTLCEVLNEVPTDESWVSQAKMCTKTSFNKFVFYRRGLVFFCLFVCLFVCFLFIYFPLDSSWAFSRALQASVACHSRGWIISQERSCISIMWSKGCILRARDEEYRATQSLTNFCITLKSISKFQCLNSRATTNSENDKVLVLENKMLVQWKW